MLFRIKNIRSTVSSAIIVAVVFALGFGLGARPWENRVVRKGQQHSVVNEGRILVETYCADCHAVWETGQSIFDPAPLFRNLHKRYDVDLLAEALVEGIVTAHPAMPEFEFDPDQATAIIAYLKSLAP